MGRVESQLEAPFSAATVMALCSFRALSLSFSAAFASCCQHKLCAVVLALVFSTLALGGYSCDCIKIRAASGGGKTFIIQLTINIRQVIMWSKIAWV